MHCYRRRDGLGGIAERHPELDVSPTPGAHPQLEISEQAGVDIALELLRSHPPRSVTYLAMGPLTTLAKMLQADGDLVRDRIGRIVCMGGALDVPGNTSPVAECKRKHSNLLLCFAYLLQSTFSLTPTP